MRNDQSASSVALRHSARTCHGAGSMPGLRDESRSGGRVLRRPDLIDGTRAASRHDGGANRLIDDEVLGLD